MCAIVFTIFSFCWLYCFQADVLMMAQHVLSKGVTRYQPLIGALVITLSLLALQLLVYKFLKLKKRSHAFTYLPSMLILAMLSSVVSEGNSDISFSLRWWAVLLILVVWALMVSVARMTQDVESDNEFGLLSRPMWINLLFLSLMMMGVVWIGNTNAVFHYRMKVMLYVLWRQANFRSKAIKSCLCCVCMPWHANRLWARNSLNIRYHAIAKRCFLQIHLRVL